MVVVTCIHCGSRFEPYGKYEDYEGPIPCAGCHKATWVSVVRGTVVVSEKWPRGVDAS
jgi:hypothetical protein